MCFIDTDCNKRGPTFRLVVAGTQVQTSCNFETNAYICNGFMDYVHCRSFYNLLEYSYNFMVSKNRYSSVSSQHNLRLHKNFSLSASKSNSCSEPCCSRTTGPRNSTEHSSIQKGSEQCTVGAVDFRVICYLPYNIAVALSPQREMSFSTYHHAVIFTGTTVHSSLNPLLYCWKIREVRQAVKETWRQVFCRSS